MTTLEQVQQTVTDAAVAVTNAVGDAANTTAEALGVGTIAPSVPRCAENTTATNVLLVPPPSLG